MTVPAAGRVRRMLFCLPMLCAAALAGAADAASGFQPVAMHHYALLERALLQYQELAGNSALTRLPPLPSRVLRPGTAYQGMPALRNLLMAVGDLPRPAAADEPDAAGATPEPALLDAATTAALRRFQERHGLEQDGLLGPATWRALTTPLAARLRQIERTLARWRALPASPHERAIFINIPRFRLYAMNAAQDQEAAMLQMDVVVGRTVERLRTPVFSADLTHLVFRPYWDVPRSITTAEILPAARRDPAWLSRHHYELLDRSGKVVPYSAARLDELQRGTLRVRQRPGDDNALGAVKFVLPNPDDIYLHDTPDRKLFARTVRAFSHGCIRVAEPARLAAWLLGDDASWTTERIAQAMQGSAPLPVNLATPVRVYIVYGTAIAREDGSVLFLDDL
jgi:murein L,D-transpeptidase YcbB/YkuD